MSNMSTVHDFVKFDSKTSKPFDGQRLAKVTYKLTEKMKKEGKTAKPSICVSIPKIEASLIPAMLPIIQERLEHAQDGIVKSLYEAGKMQVSDSEITQEACVQFLLDELEGERLTKEDVKEWFTENLQEALEVLLTEALGENKKNQIPEMVSQYKESFAGLSGGKTHYSPAKAQKLVRVLELAELNDEISIRFSSRLQKMMEVKEDNLLAL